MPAPDQDGIVRRTSLAGERTLLAWWRTALTALAVAFGVGRLLPELASEETRWPYAVLGAGFAIYGIVLFVLGTRRMSGFGLEKSGTLTALMVTGTLLGVGTLGLILAQ